MSSNFQCERNILQTFHSPHTRLPTTLLHVQWNDLWWGSPPTSCTVLFHARDSRWENESILKPNIYLVPRTRTRTKTRSKETWYRLFSWIQILWCTAHMTMHISAYFEREDKDFYIFVDESECSNNLNDMQIAQSSKPARKPFQYSNDG